jgi:hypothetical protein
VEADDGLTTVGSEGDDAMITRRAQARTLRREAATWAYLRPHIDQATNGEEGRYLAAPPGSGPSYIANYSKGLPHNAFGEVDPAAYRAMVRALVAGSPEGFEQIPVAHPAPGGRPLVNPQAGLAYDLEGPDGPALTMPPPPQIDSAEVAAEIAELYWMALLRDVPFGRYGTDSGPSTTSDAASSLTHGFSGFTGPRDATGQVTADTLFRGLTPGDLRGPYVSQFLLKPVTFGTLTTPQRQLTAQAGLDHLVDVGSWLAAQDGQHPTQGDVFQNQRRYIRTGRDLATYVHFDGLYEAYLHAALILLDLRAPFDPGNPYTDSTTQQGFGTYGGPHVLSLVTEVATRALKAVWHQKWFVHRRLRPEAFGGVVHMDLTPGAPDYPIHQEIRDSAGPGGVLERVRAHNGGLAEQTYLLPQAFPEGSPMHPAYGAGHATVAGACVTVLKAWFETSSVVPDPVVPNAGGTVLHPYTGADAGTLTVGGELDKLAANISLGRNFAGVHWRTDYTASLRLGEEIAVQIMREQSLCTNEASAHFSLTRFDGTAVTI